MMACHLRFKKISSSLQSFQKCMSLDRSKALSRLSTRTPTSPCIHIYKCTSIGMGPSPNVNVCYNPKERGVEEEALLATVAVGRSFVLDVDLVIGRTGGSVVAGAMGGVCFWVGGSV